MVQALSKWYNHLTTRTSIQVWGVDDDRAQRGITTRDVWPRLGGDVRRLEGRSSAAGAEVKDPGVCEGPGRAQEGCPQLHGQHLAGGDLTLVHATPTYPLMVLFAPTYATMDVGADPLVLRANIYNLRFGMLRSLL